MIWGEIAKLKNVCKAKTSSNFPFLYFHYYINKLATKIHGGTSLRLILNWHLEKAGMVANQ